MSFIDWDSVWQSLDWGSNGHKQNVDLTLSQRAEKYAHPPESDTLEDQDTLKALVYVQGHERYAIPANYVMRGVAEPRITPLPCVPPYYRGVVNLRGQILSVLDLQRFWGLPATESGTGTPRLVVVRAGRLELALQVDNVLELARIPLPEIVPPVTAGVGLDHVQGVSSDGIVIIDIESLVTDHRLIVHEEL